MPQDYTYDLFISYRREPPVLDWVKNHFHPLLEQWLPNYTPGRRRPKIFIDWKIETGSAWPLALEQALRMSRCLVSVWSPEYFRSRWCVAEWKTMQRRETLCRLKSSRNSAGLVYPVVFADGEFFPRGALSTQHKDMRAWNSPYPVFRETANYINFDQEVQNVCQELARMIQRAPGWKRWPVVRPQPLARARVRLPRLK